MTKWLLSGQHCDRARIALTAHGEVEASALGTHLRGLPFCHVLTSPLDPGQRALALEALGPTPRIEPDLEGWGNGDDKRCNSADIRKLRAGLILCRDFSPSGESRAGREISTLAFRSLKG